MRHGHACPHAKTVRPLAAVGDILLPVRCRNQQQRAGVKPFARLAAIGNAPGVPVVHVAAYFSLRESNGPLR